MKQKALAYTAALVSVVVWGFSFIGMKWVMRDFPPMTMTCIRYFIAAGIMMPALAIVRPGLKLRPGFSKPVVISGLLLGLFSALESQGVKYTTSSVASLIFAAVPMILLFAELIFDKKKPTIYEVLGVGASGAGVCLLIIFSSGEQADATNPALGNMLIVASCIAWVVYTLLSKKALREHSALYVTSWHMLWGAIAIVPFSLAEIPQWHEVPLLTWGVLIAMVVFCNVIGYFAYNYALHRLGSVTLNTVINFQPFVTIIASFFILSEMLTPVQFVGGAVVIVGIVIITVPFKKILLRMRVSRRKALPSEASRPIQ